MYYNYLFVCGSVQGVGDVAVSPAGTGPPVVRVGDDDALVFAMREFNQQTAGVMKEIERTAQPAIITNHGRFVATVTLLAPGQVERRVFPEIARQVAERPPAGTEPPKVRVGDDDAFVFAMRELNQQTARIMKKIEKTGQPVIITNRGRFIAIIRPLAPGQVESRVFPRSHARSQNGTKASPPPSGTPPAPRTGPRRITTPFSRRSSTAGRGPTVTFAIDGSGSVHGQAGGNGPAGARNAACLPVLDLVRCHGGGRAGVVRWGQTAPGRPGAGTGAGPPQRTLRAHNLTPNFTPCQES